MKKNLLLVIIVLIVIGLVVAIFILVPKNENENTEINENVVSTNSTTIQLETIQSDTGFKTFTANSINITNPNANFIFLNDLNGTSQDELTVTEGYIYSFKKFGEHKIEILELTDDYMTISIKGLAPTKETGGFSLIGDYDKVTIEKNTGICLNVQATDIPNGSVYLFYVNK